jgi:hypothetical protein
MEDYEEKYFGFHIGIEDYYNEKKNENFYNESNKNEEQKIVSTGENHNSNNLKFEKHEINYINENHLINGSNNIYNNLEEIINEEKNSDNKNLINNDAVLMNSDIFQDNNKIELLNLNRDTYNSQTINGKQIITTNEMISNKLQELFNNSEINMDKLKDMQMLKKKKKRRTKKEIERDKTLSQEEKKQDKKKGRIKKDSEENLKSNVNHPKEADDNIVKKINTFYLEEIRKWLNKSFLDENKTNFETLKSREKNKKGIFMRLSPELISNKIKKATILNIMNTKFKDLFYSNKISLKYKKKNPEINRELINKIYKEGKESFVIFILEMKFIEGLNFFNGLIQDEQIINYFKNNYKYSEELVKKFVGNFGKIGSLLDKLYRNSDKDEAETKDYLTKINVLCLNYKESFENKYDRKENKKE